MNYGFVIDNRKCIGCHACSTACKMENEVPLGVNRTWVKSVETGAFPDVRRHFQVTRCNHCANPPCVRICPVTAMYQRTDGIVEFDPKTCIGCKACLQACPYDAIYIDPNSGTAAKCHYCAHRTDIGLEPACVVVCPEHAIIAGDLDDPTTEISRMIATQRVTVRKPEQGTSPKLFYIEGNEFALHPTATERAPATFAFSDVIPLHATAAATSHAALPPTIQAKGSSAPSGAAIRTPRAQGGAGDVAIYIGEGRMAEQMVQVTYNAQHKVPWHWQVPAYLVTKGIGAGSFILLNAMIGFLPVAGNFVLFAGFVSLLFTAATAALLVLDLERPERFIKIMLRPQWRSWLARGAFLLTGFGLLAALWWLYLLLGWFGILNSSGVDGVPLATSIVQGIAVYLGIPLAIGVAIYTAFLFGQAEGRDLWQSPLLPLHMLVQALMVGSGMLLVIALFVPMLIAPAQNQFVRYFFAATVLLDLFVTLVGEFAMPHSTDIAARAAHEISHGRYRMHFWAGSIGLGHVAPLLLGLVAWQPTLALAGLCAIVGLYLYEYAFVLAPQEIPNS